MPGGGKLLLETKNVQLDSTVAEDELNDIPPGRYVSLSMADTGTGMDAQTREHIFEPFFTTKSADKGTGLGLSTVFGIVKQSGGYIRVDSEPGRGTRFDIYLPRVDEAVSPRRGDSARPQSLEGGEIVLVVEDEELVRRAVCRTMRKHGYRVIEASHGGDALLAVENHEGGIHLMITDLVMPRISGRDLAERLAPAQPEMRVLFMSGYTEDEATRHAVLEEGRPFIAKPFSSEALLRKVREVLDA